MKRMICLITLSLLCLAAAAQTSLVGTWTSTAVKLVENGMTSYNTIQHTFNADGSFTERSSADVPDFSSEFSGIKGKLHASIKMHASVSGKYRIEGNKLILSYEHKKADGAMDSLKITVEDPEQQKAIDNAKGLLNKMLGGQLAKAMKKRYKEISGVKTAFTVSASSMEYTDEEGHHYTFHKGR